jgi:hypothetical protein
MHSAYDSMYVYSFWGLWKGDGFAVPSAGADVVVDPILATPGPDAPPQAAKSNATVPSARAVTAAVRTCRRLARIAVLLLAHPSLYASGGYAVVTSDRTCSAEIRKASQKWHRMSAATVVQPLVAYEERSWTKGTSMLISRSHTATAAVALILGLVTLALAACGGTPPGVASIKGSPTATATIGGSSSNSGGPPTAAELRTQLKFVHCVRTHGVPNMPDPLPGGGYSRSALSALPENWLRFAEKDCRSLAIATGWIHTKAQIQAHIAKMLKISECMQSHGFPNFPDPDADGGFMISSPSSLDMSSPRYAAAAKKCDAPPGPSQSRQAG